MRNEGRNVKAGTALMAISAVLAASPAAAQDPALENSNGGQIIVTGSRIPRPDLEANVPIAVVSEESIQADGAANVQDTLNELPQVGIGSSRTNTNGNDTGIGIASVNLRNLGNDRTLVLVNGRRFIAGGSGRSTVDINNIAPDLIERIDVVTSGASAVYGSDAIAGVVNFIMKSEFSGVRLRGQAGITERGDNERVLVSLTGGTKWGSDDRGNIILFGSYDRDSGLRNIDRAFAREDTNLTTIGPGAWSSFPPQGRFDLRTSNGSAQLFTFNPDNSLLFGFPVTYGFNRSPHRRISVPVERYLASSIANYELTPSIRAFGELTYSKVRASGKLEPYSFEWLDIYKPADLGMPITNPYIPAAVKSFIAARNTDANSANDIVSIQFRRRQNEVYQRLSTSDRDTWRASVGLEGDLGSDWKYGVGYVYGSLNDYTFTEDFNAANYRQALDAIVDPATGQIVCRSAEARAQGCVPVNLFGYDTVTPQAADWVKSIRSNQTNVKQHVATVNLSGTLFSLPAGDIGVALGAEYRRESSRSDWDEQSNSFKGLLDTQGRFDLWEVYGEVRVPILSNTPLADYLGVTGAIRYSDYSTVGGVLSWQVGGEYAPVEDLRFRAMYSVANRAPNIGELFSPFIEGSVTVTDPCDGVTATSSRQRDAACRAIPAIAAQIAQNGALKYIAPIDFTTISAFRGGNPNLFEETARTITAGVVITPRWLRGFSLAVDYYDITVDNAIGTIPANITVDQCLATGEGVFCDNVIRHADSGKLDLLRLQNINTAQIKTRGVDVDVRYTSHLGLVADDRLDLGLMYTNLLSLEKISYLGGPLENNLGQLGGSGRLGAGFKHKALAKAAFTTGPFTGSWQVKYLSKIQDTIGFDISRASDPALIDDYNHVGAAFYHDIQLRWAAGPKRALEFYFGVDNVFDKQPPFIPQGLSSQSGNTNTAPDTFDVYGRRFYAGAVVSF